MVFREGFGKKIDAYPTKGTYKLIEYKTYLQALPYFDRLKGNCEVTKWTPLKRKCCKDPQQSKYD
jgi:hypothetical protein